MKNLVQEYLPAKHWLRTSRGKDRLSWEERRVTEISDWSPLIDRLKTQRGQMEDNMSMLVWNPMTDSIFQENIGDLWERIEQAFLQQTQIKVEIPCPGTEAEHVIRVNEEPPIRIPCDNKKIP